MTADIQIEKQWNFDSYSKKLDNAIAVASSLNPPSWGKQQKENIMARKFVLVEENSQWNNSELRSFDIKSKSLEDDGYQVIKMDGYAIYLRSVAIRMIFASLDKHKGKAMSTQSKTKFIQLMSEFNNLPVISAFSSYSIVNKIVKTRMRINDFLSINTTYFEGSDSDDIAFSIECDNEFILAGSGSASDLASKFAQLINELTDERIS